MRDPPPFGGGTADLNSRGKQILAIRKKLTFSWQAAGVSS